MKSIVCYSLGNIKPKQRTKFIRELYGYNDVSNHRRYSYERKGILSEIEYTKPFDSVLIIEGSIKKVILHLKQYNAKYIKHRLR